jgi:hypothetical protein
VNHRFKDAESSRTLIVSIVGLLAFNLFYFGLALPLSQISDSSLFWASYLAWGALGFGMLSRDAKNDPKGNRRAKSAAAIFAAILASLLALAAVGTIPGQVPLAFVGFFAGIAVWGAVVLLIRFA